MDTVTAASVGDLATADSLIRAVAPSGQQEPQDHQRLPGGGHASC